MCYKIAKEINENECYKKAFNKIYDILYHGDFSVIKELWKIKDINTLFMSNINPFVTNLMIILGYEIHQNSLPTVTPERLSHFSRQKKQHRPLFSERRVPQKWLKHGLLRPFFSSAELAERLSRRAPRQWKT